MYGITRWLDASYAFSIVNNSISFQTAVNFKSDQLGPSGLPVSGSGDPVSAYLRPAGDGPARPWLRRYPRLTEIKFSLDGTWTTFADHRPYGANERSGHLKCSAQNRFGAGLAELGDRWVYRDEPRRESSSPRKTG
jgi:hypothetical protein